MKLNSIRRAFVALALVAAITFIAVFPVIASAMALVVIAISVATASGTVVAMATAIQRVASLATQAR